MGQFSNWIWDERKNVKRFKVGLLKAALLFSTISLYCFSQKRNLFTDQECWLSKITGWPPAHYCLTGRINSPKLILLNYVLRLVASKMCCRNAFLLTVLISHIRYTIWIVKQVYICSSIFNYHKKWTEFQLTLKINNELILRSL